MKKIFFAVLSLLIASNAFATVYPFITPWPAFRDSSDSVCTGCLLYVYETGTSTPKTTYTTSDASVANSNPITLNSLGQSSTGIFFSGTAKFVLKTSGGTTIRTYDGMTPAIGTTTDAATQWYATGLTPTYVSTSSFSTDGDNTLVFQVGRRIKITDTADVNYGRISASSYSSSLTTVTVQLDSGSIDSGISAVSVGLTTPTNPSVAFDSITTGTSAANLTSSGSNTWSGAQVVTGAITSSGANSFSGAQTVTGSINSSATNTWSNTQTVTGGINSSGTNTLSGTQNITGGIVTSGTNTWSGTQTGTLTITGNINSSGTNTFSGTQNVTGGIVSSGTNTWSGTQAGTLTITADINSSGTNTISGTTTVSGAATFSGGVTSSGTTTISGGGSISGSYSGAPTFSAGLISSGTITGDLVGDVTGNADTATTATTASNLALTDEVRSNGSGTATSGGASLLTVDLGTVTAGDRILISAKAQFDKGGTAGRSLLAVGKSSGTATILYSSDAAISTSYSTSINQDASSTHHLALTTIAAVTQTGTYVLTLDGVSAGSDSTIIANAAGIHLFFLKKQ